MIYTPKTPFRRAISAGELQSASPKSITKAVDKWKVLKTLAVARERLALSDRDLTVLQAVISFHPGSELDVSCGASLTVYPSNNAICMRLNGMPCSTMRRHLDRLIKAGLLARRDSPNGKRFVRGAGIDRHVFGFDLSPLAIRSAEFSAMAADVEGELEQASSVRMSVMLMRRDLTALIEMCENEDNKFPYQEEYVTFGWHVTRALRRKLDLAALQALQEELLVRLALVKAHAKIPETNDLSTKVAQIEHHYHNSNKEYLDSDRPEETTNQQDSSQRQGEPNAHPIRLSLADVLGGCSAIKAYTTNSITTWDDLLRAAETVRPMMGIGSTVWLEAKKTMGVYSAASLLTAMLERFDDILSPSAYMRHLARKYRLGSFSIVGMLSAASRNLKDKQLSLDTASSQL